eukprot:UN03959
MFQSLLFHPLQRSQILNQQRHQQQHQQPHQHQHLCQKNNVQHKRKLQQKLKLQQQTQKLSLYHKSPLHHLKMTPNLVQLHLLQQNFHLKKKALQAQERKKHLQKKSSSKAYNIFHLNCPISR